MQDKSIFSDTAESYVNKHTQFGNIIKELGSGYNGVAFLTDKGFVIKVTKDEEEYKTALKIFNSLNGLYTPKYYGVDEFEDLYVIVMDKVDPLNLSDEENKMLNTFRDFILMKLENGEDVSKLKSLLPNFKNKKMEVIFSGLIDCIVGLSKVGIINDDIQEDNIGLLNGKIVLFDVVETEHQLAEVIKNIRSVIREMVRRII